MASKVLTDLEINQLLAEPKPVTEVQFGILSTPRKLSRHRDLFARIHVVSKSGGKFQIMVRGGEQKPHDFSVIVTYRPRGGRLYTLRRCNGWHGEHQNTLEQNANTGIQIVPPHTFHIHMLTERYQNSGKHKGDHYAEPTASYYSMRGAIEFACQSFGFFNPNEKYKSRYALWEK